MRKIIFLCLLVSAFGIVAAQQKVIDSLKRELAKTGEDTTRVLLLNELALSYYLFRPDTAISFAQQAYDISQNLHYTRGTALSLNRIAAGYSTLGDYAKAIQLFDRALQISQENNDLEGTYRAYNNIGDIYATQKDYKKALEYFKMSQAVQQSWMPSITKAILLLNIGDSYISLGQYDSADVYLRGTYAAVKKEGFSSTYGYFERNLGLVEAARKNFPAALAFFRKSVESCLATDDLQYLSTTYAAMANFYKERGQRDSAIAYTKKALFTAQACSYNLGILEASKELSDFYAGNNNEEAFRYLSLATAARDSLFSQEKVKQILSFSFEQKQREQDLETARTESRNKAAAGRITGYLSRFSVSGGFTVP
jgi:tetratricopeptide (TPR) repeat protein